MIWPNDKIKSPIDENKYFLRKNMEESCSENKNL